MTHYQKKNTIFMKIGAALLAFSVMTGTTALAAIGDRVQLNKSAAIYLNAYDAKNQTNPAGKFPSGSYYIYTEHKTTSTINITKQKGVPGAWIKGSLLTNTGSSNLSNTSASTQKVSKLSQSGYTTGRVNFRSKPSVKNSLLSKIPAGTKLNAERYNQSWYRVEYKGKIGYVHASLFSIKSSVQTQNKLHYPLPSNSFVVTSEFAYRIHPITGKRTHHDGIDLAAPKGTKIYAIADGVITASSLGSISGNFVIVKHRDGLESFYGHMSKRAVSVGQKVSKGAVIGYVGTTGRSTGNHLHFEIRKNGVKLNPRKHFKF